MTDVWEFIGMPGSGKTSVARPLLNQITQQYNGKISDKIDLRDYHSLKNSPNVIQAIYIRISSFVKKPTIVFILYMISFKAHGLNMTKFKGVQGFINEYFAYSKMLTSDNDCQLIDEGPLHWVFSLTFGGSIEKAKSWILKFFSLSYSNPSINIVWIKVDKMICVKRFLNRKLDTSSFNETTPKEQIKQFIHYPYEDLISLLTTTIIKPVQIVRSDLPIDEIVDDLMRVFNSSENGP